MKIKKKKSFAYYNNNKYKYISFFHYSKIKNYLLNLNKKINSFVYFISI